MEEIILFYATGAVLLSHETVPDTHRMGNWADPIANVDTGEGRENSGNLFSCFSRL